MSDYLKTFAGTDPADLDNCPEFLARYIQYLQDFKGRKVSYVQNTLLTLREFCQFSLFIRLQPHAQPAKELKSLSVCDMDLDIIASITVSDAERYLQFAESILRNSSSTLHKKIAYLRNFYYYLEGNAGELNVQFPNGNPFRNIKFHAASTASFGVLSPKEVQQLLNGVPSGENEARDKAIILLLVTTSLNISELAALNRTDLSLDTPGAPPSVRVRRQNRKLSLPLSQPCVKALKAYLRSTDPLLPAYQFALFLSSKELNRMTERGIQKRIKIAAGCSGLQKNISAKVLRNTAIHNLLNNIPNGADDQLREELGLKTNYAFRRVSGSLLAQAVANSPLNNLADADTDNEPED